MPSSSQKIQRVFLSSPRFAVVGASKDQSKYGNKVFRWYLSRNRDVTPINLRESDIEGVKALKSLADLPHPSTTSISVITPPKISLGILQEAKALGVPSLWLQPGSEDAEVKEWVKENLSDRVVLGGPCILVLGEGVIRSLL